MRFSVSPHLSVLSAVVARLFSSCLVASPLSSVSALAPTTLRSTLRLNRWRGNCLKSDTLNNRQRWIHSSVFPSISSKTTTSLFSVENVDSATICSDESVLRLLDQANVDLIESLVQERSKARWTGNYAVADELKTQITTFSDIPSGYELVLKDIARNEGGGSRWNLVHTKEIYDETILNGPSILQLAHVAMGLAVENNHQQQTLERRNYKQKSLDEIAKKAKSRLEILLEETKKMDAINAVFEVSTKNTMVQSELGGRTAADAALWFAFAGSRDHELFEMLADISAWELERFGKRPSFRSKYTLQILERFAAAGQNQHNKLERVARESLSEKQDENDQSIAAGLNLHSDRSLLLIWKFASKQKKQRAFLRSVKKNWEEYYEEEVQNDSSNRENNNDIDKDDTNNAIINPSYDWNELFQDTSRPLVVDVGCGMGVSLLGLAASKDDQQSQESSRLLLENDLHWSECNFVGVDLGALGIDYARGVAHRWGMEDNLHFCIDAAEDFCKHLDSYPGDVRCCMIQFPTPFRLQNKNTGNSQLPASQAEGFMVTENLLGTIRSSLHPTKGKLLLQSNCEDVAVWMRNLASKQVGFAIVEDDNKENDSNCSASTVQRLPQRTAEWISMGGERAEGKGWYHREILHRKGATETEVSCAINGTPVHRCILQVGDKSESI